MLPHCLVVLKHIKRDADLMVFIEVNNLPRTNGGAYAINLDKCKSVGTHWIVVCINIGNGTYFNNFGVEYIPKIN